MQKTYILDGEGKKHVVTPPTSPRMFLTTSREFFDKSEEEGGLFLRGQAAGILGIFWQEISRDTAGCKQYLHNGSVYLSGKDCRRIAERRGLIVPQQLAA